MFFFFFLYKKTCIPNAAWHRRDGLQITCYPIGTVVLNDGGPIKINCGVLGIPYGRKNNNPPNIRDRFSECVLGRLRPSLSQNVSGLMHALCRRNDENCRFFIIGPGDQRSGNGNGDDGDKRGFDVNCYHMPLCREEKYVFFIVFAFIPRRWCPLLVYLS